MKLKPRVCDLPRVTYLYGNSQTWKYLLTPSCSSVSHCLCFQTFGTLSQNRSIWLKIQKIKIISLIVDDILLILIINPVMIIRISKWVCLYGTIAICLQYCLDLKNKRFPYFYLLSLNHLISLSSNLNIVREERRVHLYEITHVWN